MRSSKRMATEGVEKEAHSRFVDYTTATPWEELVADIERLLTRWHKRAVGDQCEAAELSYMGYTFRLAFYDGEAATVSAIYRWYDVGEFALLARTNDWIDLTPSEMKSIFSALVCGLQASGTPVPVFFASSSTDRLDDATVVLGYEICSSRSTWQRDSVRHFESSLLDSNIDAKHDLFFVDGLLKHFKGSIHHFSSLNQLRIAVGETFTHTQQSEPFVTSSSNEQVTYSKDITRTDFIVSSLGRCRRSRGLICHQLSVHLAYQRTSFENLQDSASYTTLVPSKQPADSWKMNVSFRKDSSSLPSEADDVYALGYASCLRRILALYIYGKSVEAGVRMAGLKLDSWAFERASSISSILSVATSNSLKAFASSNLQDDGTDIKMSSDKDCLPLLFSQSMESQNNDAEWLSLLSVLVGCSQGTVEDVAGLWRNCLQRLRTAWESKEVDGFQFLGSSKHRGEMGATEGEVVPSVPLWKRSLWEDLLFSEGEQLSLPDVEKSILMQKLQMLRFCTAVKDCKATVDCNYSHPIANGPVGDISTPCLVRRNPITHDAEALAAFASQNLPRIAGSAGTLKVRLPALVSDICAFKAANPTVNYDSFRQWYQLDLLEKTEQDFKASDFHELWASLDACEATQQKPMFRAEAEAEKSLIFLESITPLQFSAEMLIVAITVVLPLLEGEVREWAVATDGDAAAAEVLQVLAKVKKDAVCASKRIRNDVAQFGSSAADSSISQDTLLLIDGVCQEMGELETFCIKARELDSLLTLPEETGASRMRQAGLRAERRRLVTSLARFCAATAVDGTEAKRMQGLARAFSRGRRPSHHHTWHSTDGRELPLGSSKTVTIACAEAPTHKLRAIIEPARIRLLTTKSD